MRKLFNWFRRIDSNTAALYRYAIASGINEARSEFSYGKFVRPATIRGELGVSGAVKFVQLSSRAYSKEKRKHGWISERKPDATKNGMPVAVQAALAAF